MLNITEPVPIEYLQEVQTLSSEFDARLPDNALDKNLLITTWNLRVFGFKDFILMSPGLPKQALSGRISDHYPLWAEFLVR
jgi:endonuclease/exonuclease/phosphatase family metal-dependent hydrolase